jgi:hypothetical protein
MKTFLATLFFCLYSFSAKASSIDTIFYQNKLIKAIKKDNVCTFFNQSKSIVYVYDYNRDSIILNLSDTSTIYDLNFIDSTSISNFDVAPNYFNSHCNFNCLHVKYPIDESINEIQGTVIVTLKIDRFGNVLDTKIKQSLTPNCDKACLKSLDALNKCWYPAIKNKKFVDSEISLKFHFKLD